MRIFLIILLLLAGIAPSAAIAGNEPMFAAAPDWVERQQVPTANPKHSERPFQTLLYTIQTSFSAEGSTSYLETAYKIQSAEGLTASGTIAIAWQPDRSDLIIHKLEIARDGVPRNVLAEQRFSVLRREKNLEAALLDGMLTATIQPEDLRIGDVVHVAYSIRAKPDSIGFKPENSMSLLPGMNAGLVLFREIWPDEVPLRWAASPGMGKLNARKTKFGNELRAEFRDIEVPLPPPSAPARFVNTMFLEATAYRDWAEISALLAPLYAKATALPENSSLKVEARSIRDATPAPKARALAALRLVQDKVRYLALAMNEGGYIPASAEETWNRRFGDCKGKSATLVALLKELEIEAEPVLVHVIAGDVLPTRLPQSKLFNHVIVHATIEGKSYWLDGTRQGDRDLDELASSRFRYGLPLREPGATLEALPFIPPLKPLLETKITYDASEGLFVPAKVQGEMIHRGDLATVMRLTLAQIGDAEFKKRLDVDRYLPGATDQAIEFNADADQGTFTVSFSGRKLMDWNKYRQLASPRFRFGDSTMGWRLESKGREGVNASIPFMLGIPVHIVLREEVILPAQGKGYALEGKNFDRTVAGTRITRSLALDNGRAVVTSSLVRLQPELPAAEAQVSIAALAEIAADAAYVTAVADLEIQPWLLSREPETAEEFISRGYDRMDNQRVRYAGTDFDKAIEFVKDGLADLDQAIKLAPDSSVAHSLRAMALISLGRLDEAETALVKAHSVERVHPRAFQVRGMLHGRRGRDEEAIRDFSRYILEYNPASAKSLYERALAYEQTGKLEEARSDLKRSIELAPQSPGGTALARVTARLGKVQEAVALVDQAVAKRDSADKPAWAKANLRAIHRGRTLAMADRATEARAEYEAALREIDERLEQLPRLSGPAIDAETLALLVAKARLFATTDRAPEAIALADRVLELQPENPIMLIERCRARLYTQGQMAQARQDCDIAKRSDLANSEARYVSGLISLKAHDWDRAASDFKVLAKTGNTLALFGLGLAKFRSGETAEGGAYMELARSGSPEVDFEFHRFGITIDSDADVADGNTLPGLTLYKWGTDGHPTREPVTVEDFISRGYYRMEKWQLGDALADLDRAIGLAPDSSLAHSIRAHVLIRLGRLDDAEVAINKATSLAAVHPGSFQVRGLLKARRGRTEEAIRDFSHNLVPSETSAIWLFERGLAYERAGQFEKSLIDLQSAITLMPQPKVRVALARVTARLGDLEEAIAIADETASGLDSANLPAWRKSYLLALRRGKILRMAGREEQARSEYEAALRQVDARLAQLPAQQGPTVRGIALLRARADLLILTDQAQEAIAVADQALAVQPDNVAMLTARCEARLRASLQPTLARQDCDAARSKDPANHQTLYMSGLASLKASDWDRAAGEFQLLVKELPSAPGALFGLGVSKMRRSAGAEGGADIELARTLSSEVDADFDLFGIKP